MATAYLGPGGVAQRGGGPRGRRGRHRRRRARRPPLDHRSTGRRRAGRGPLGGRAAGGRDRRRRARDRGPPHPRGQRGARARQGRGGRQAAPGRAARRPASDEVTTVASHPHALAQCAGHLRGLGIELLEGRRLDQPRLPAGRRARRATHRRAGHPRAPPRRPGSRSLPEDLTDGEDDHVAFAVVGPWRAGPPRQRQGAVLRGPGPQPARRRPRAAGPLRRAPPQPLPDRVASAQPGAGGVRVRAGVRRRDRRPATCARPSPSCSRSAPPSSCWAPTPRSNSAGGGCTSGRCGGGSPTAPPQLPTLLGTGRGRGGRLMETGTIAVVGLGLIGGSVALDARAAGWPLVATDIDPAQREAAAAAGIAVVDARRGRGRRGGPGRGGHARARQVAEVLRRVDAARAAPVVATSVASVQAGDVLGWPSLDLARVVHVGGHPMTGTERSGFRAARRGMFDGSPWILTPEPGDPRDAVAERRRPRPGACAPCRWCCAPTSTTGPWPCSATSPTCWPTPPTAALRVVDDAGTEHLAGGSFRDATRVAATRPSFWSEVLHLNRAAVADLVADVRADLAAMEEVLRDADGARRAGAAAGRRATARSAARARTSPPPTCCPRGRCRTRSWPSWRSTPAPGWRSPAGCPTARRLTWTPL